MKQNFLFSKDYIKYDFTFQNNESALIGMDYTNLEDLSEVLEEFKNEIVEDNITEYEKLENFSFKKYNKNTDYWDLVLIVNNLKSMLDVPVDYDIVEQRALKKYQNYVDELGYTKTPRELEAKKQEYIEKEIKLNEKNRKLKYINPKVINSLNLKLRKLKRGQNASTDTK